MMRALVAQAVELGGLPVDDVLALVLPLVHETRAAHDVGRVAPLRGLDAVSVVDHALHFESSVAPTASDGAVAEVQRALIGPAVDVRRGADRRLDLSQGYTSQERADVSADRPHEPRLVAGWQRWEHLIEHHDELTDIGSLGELIAALCCGLDLADVEDARLLSTHRRNLFALSPRLHPVVAAVASSMLEPDRHRRVQDLGEVVERLGTYRDQPEDFDLDRVLVEGAAGDRRDVVLGHLRDRLFDLSRRNPLVHFRPTLRTLDLTQASVPLVMDVRSIRPAQLFTWGGPASQRLIEGKTVDVSSLVRWDDAPYAAASLDTIIAQARRDRAEYGQDQLRLVVAFLRWHDVHDAPDVAVTSPLVMAAATLTKQRGVQNSFRLAIASADAEVNPVLRHQLAETYGFDLPERVDLSDPTALEALRAEIQRQARASQPGVGVTLVERPRIELIRQHAQTALQSYRRRRAGARRAIGRRQYASSYRHPGWQPLGIQIFRDRLVRSPLPMSVELGDAPAPRQSVAEPTSEPTSERDLFSVTAGDTNPYAWEVDLCTVTLANFNYRTLSLVRDYDDLLAAPRPNAGFDELFSAEPRDAPLVDATIEVADRYLVVAADDSQLAAIAQARAGDNFVIQGPPGTGKSQTITNLMVDYVARGKRVLFVCQKRAALDVVHARLRAQGLGEICTLVHDSQSDKKAFVHGLRDTYETYLSAPADLAEVESERASLVAEMTGVHSELGAYDLALTTRGPEAPRPIDLVDRLIELHASRWPVPRTPASRRLVPSADAWFAARPHVDRLVVALERAGTSALLAESPLKAVDPRCLTEHRPDALVAERAGSAATVLTAVSEKLRAGGLVNDDLVLADARDAARVHDVLAPLVPLGQALAWRAGSSAALELTAAAATQRDLRAAAVDATARGAGWHQPLGADDARAAMAVAQQREQSFWKFVSGDWRRVRDLVRAGYDDPTRQVAPTVAEALALLLARHDAEAAVAGDAARATQRWGRADLSALEADLAAVRTLGEKPGPWHEWLSGVGDGPLLAIDGLTRLVAEVDVLAEGVLILDGERTAVLIGVLGQLAGPEGQGLVRGAAAPLTALAAHPTVLAALGAFTALPDQLEHAVLFEALQDARAAHDTLDRTDGRRMGDLLDRIVQLQPQLQRANARTVVARLRTRFVTHVELSGRSVTGMSADERETKKAWAAGRRELEHEFGKTRAYKSIRQLSEGDPGTVTAAMRPVWLVSPSSLSDTVSLSTTFDVVIYDEASQVPVEEAVPALYRAQQVIVVGDRMQLPPTRYFRSGPAPDDAGAGPDGGDDDGQQVGVVLDADSFLAVSSTRLPSTMLAWHYRSRFEALIQYSNAAFYEGRLATVPDRATEVTGRPAVVVTTGDDGPTGADVASATDAVLARSITTVRVTDGVYAARTNTAEATWVAHLVRDLLARGTHLTVGVVAFSEAQQGEIERALERLAGSDPTFATAYENEVNREEDGQTVSLFVKNLENVQGDERDIVIMSVCYAPDHDGRMRMNFGPINNQGGEKRLNVIFSRARQHMVLVSSIDPTAITNTYNDGAKALQGFLRYADAVSAGDDAGARAVLGSVVTAGSTPATTPPLAEQLAQALEGRGLDVARALGQSGFRCDLALRRPGDPAYTTAVLIDSASRVDGAAAEQRRVVQPSVLASAGWRVEQVTAPEWLDRPDDVVTRLLGSLLPPA